MLTWLTGRGHRAAREHLPATTPEPASDSCQECGQRFSLRMCGTCGHVGCCETSGGHGRDHARTTGHPIIYSMPVGRGFAWCYAERRYLG